MPIYEYRCKRCLGDFETLVWSSQEELNLTCPKCKSEDVERILSCFSKSCSSGEIGKQTGCAPSSSRGFS